MSSISQQDWDLFEEAAQCLCNPPSKDDSDLPKARSLWNQIRQESSDPKARSIAKALGSTSNPIYAYSHPLKRWSGGALKDSGVQHYLDYPEVYVSPVPSNDGVCHDCGDPAPRGLYQCASCHKQARERAGIDGGAR